MIINVIKIALLAIIGSLIGWITNKIAIKLIFRPLNPVKIPIIGITLQGVIPKRKGEIAESIGQTVEKELIQAEDVLDSLITDEKIDLSLAALKEKIAEIVEEKMSRFIVLSNFNKTIINYVNGVIDEEGKTYFKEMIHKISSQTANEVNISKIVEDRINSYDLSKIENIIMEVTKKELGYIEFLGAVLGLFIGIMQGIIIILFDWRI